MVVHILVYLSFLVYLLASFETKLHDSHCSVVETTIKSSTASASVSDKAVKKSSDMHKKPSDNSSIGRTKSADSPYYRFDREAAEAHLQQHGPTTFRKTITAYLEPPVNYIAKPANQGDPDNDEDPGYPPEYIVPLPLRTSTTPFHLKKYEYPKFQTCRDSPAATFPIDRGLDLLEGGGKPWNIGDDPLPDNYASREAAYCPVDADPFLPQIHDMFPSHDGKVIEFIAHNKRRCRTGRNSNAMRLDPQGALFQPVTVQIMTEAQAQELAPNLWTDDSSEETSPRYRLAPLEESDGTYTRFICRFYATDFSNQQAPHDVLVEENLSIYPFNYEYVTYHKRRHSMLTPKGKDIEYYWMAVLRFQCPVPTKLQHLVKSGNSILSDGTPTIHVDVIPIRTPPRYGTKDMYLSEDMIGPKDGWGVNEKEFWGWRNGTTGASVQGFDPKEAWGEGHVLPRVEASGRWSNLPICEPPRVPSDDADATNNKATTVDEVASKNKPHFLSACLWASAIYKARGNDKDTNADPSLRLLEWIEFHLMVGFDHIYVYDNSGAQSNETSFASIVELFPKSQVTYIDWPVTICNHNPKSHDSQFEWSSQYTAENSCRTRAAPFTEWISHFDIDEYFVPMGKHTSLREVLEGPSNNGTNILTFRSSRSQLLYAKSQGGETRAQLGNATFLEAYNCDLARSPKPNWANRRKKQIYRADFVPYHFVHYSPVTKGLLKTYKDDPSEWKPYEEGYREKTERIVDEIHEAVMFHTKTIAAKDTKEWQAKCKTGKTGCLVGFPWPKGVEEKEKDKNEEGYSFNCFKNSKVERYWAPRLRGALKSRTRSLSARM
jgi:hypothetical protein